MVAVVPSRSGADEVVGDVPAFAAAVGELAGELFKRRRHAALPTGSAYRFAFHARLYSRSRSRFFSR